MTLKYLIRKEFLQIKRNAFLPKLIIVFPIMIMCVMPWVMNMEIKNIVVDVVDNDRSTLSQQLVHRIEASDYFIFNGQKASYADALKDVEKSKADVIVEIPANMERDLKNNLHPQVLVAANAVNGTKGSMGSSYLSNIVTQHVSPETVANSAKLSTLYLYNKHLNYKVFYDTVAYGDTNHADVWFSACAQHSGREREWYHRGHQCDTGEQVDIHIGKTNPLLDYRPYRDDFMLHSFMGGLRYHICGQSRPCVSARHATGIHL